MINHISSDIIIVGAGAAGLMAARELAPHFSVTILEARSEPGGRIRTIYTNNKRRIELGPEFVHGRLPITTELIRLAGLSLTPVSGDIVHADNGKWVRANEIIEGWDALLRKMQDADDSTMLAFLQKHYSGDKYAALRSHIARYVEGFDLADLSRVSMKALLYEWINESQNFRIDEGYMALVRFLENECRQLGCRFVYNYPVKLVEWKDHAIKAYKDSENFTESSKLLVSIPLGLLQSQEAVDAICFYPSLDDHHAAAQTMGYGTVIKFVLEFSTPFWRNKEQDLGFIISDQQVPTWWTQGHDDNTLTGWLGGPPAEEWVNAGDEQLLAVAIHSLANIFHLSYAEISSMLSTTKVLNWARDKWAGGGYSYATLSSTKALNLFNTPVRDTIYFAGEAFYQGEAPGTVEAALTSGKLAAEKIRNSVSV